MNALRAKGTYAGKSGARGLARAKRTPAIKGKRAVGPERQYLAARKQRR